MRQFHLEIVTPDGLEFDGMAESLLTRTDDGDVEILAGHADLIATVGIGRTRIISGGKTVFASSAGGFLSVKGGEVRLVTVTFELQDDIDLERAKRAKERAEELLKSKSGEKDIRIAKAKLARALNRINVANMK